LDVIVAMVSIVFYDVPHKLDKAIRETRCTIVQRKH